MRVTIPLSQFGKMEAAMARKFQRAAGKALREGARACVPRLRLATAMAKPTSPGGGKGAVASGRFLRSWKWRAVDALTVEVFNAAKHAVFVEYGRRPGKAPPLRAILKWMRYKGLGKSRQTARLIARAIARRGIPGRGIMDTQRPRLTLLVMRRIILAYSLLMSKSAKGQG